MRAVTVIMSERISFKLNPHFRADCSNADKPGAIPQHNGLTQFGKVTSNFLSLNF